MKANTALDHLEKLAPQVTSQSVEEALNTFSQANESLRMAQSELDFCDKKTQDLLHELELCDWSYHERAHAAIELREIRQRRRAAKDIIEVLTPLITWLTAQTNAVNQLKQCLGAMRKAESKAESRVYYKRACNAGENYIVADGKGG